VCVVGSAAADLIIDASGWFDAGTNATWLPAPTRVFSTRDGIGVVKAKVTAGSVLTFPFASVPPGSTAAVVNLTVTDTEAGGFLTAYPCGSPTPDASNLNFAQGSTVANLAIVRPGVGNAVCIYSSATTDIIADLSGWLADGYTPLPQPKRILSTRDGVGSAKAKVDAGKTLTLPLSPPVGAVAAVLNVTVTNTAGAGFLTVSGCGSEVPNASTLNFQSADTVANLALVGAASGSACLTPGQAATDIIVDLSGWLSSPSGYHALAAPIRVLDSRKCVMSVYSVDTSPPTGTSSVISSSDIYARDTATGASTVIAKAVAARPGLTSTWYGRFFLSRDCYAYTVVHTESSTNGLVTDRFSNAVVRINLRTGDESFIASVDQYPIPVVLGDGPDDTLVLTFTSSYDSQVWSVSRATGFYVGLPYINYVSSPSGIAVSPGARFVYFLERDFSVPQTTLNLTELNTTNGERRTVGKGFDGRATVRSVSPNGSALLVDSPRKLEAVNLATGARSLVPLGTNPNTSWTADSRVALVLDADPTTIVALNPNGTTSPLLSSSGAAISWFSL
jgi:hypothetical protein